MSTALSHPAAPPSLCRHGLEPRSSRRRVRRTIAVRASAAAKKSGDDARRDLLGPDGTLATSTSRSAANPTP